MKWENIFNRIDLSLALLLCAVSSCRVALALALCLNVFALPLVFPNPPKCNKFFYWGKNENYITYWCSILEKFKQRALGDKSKEAWRKKQTLRGKEKRWKENCRRKIFYYIFSILFYSFSFNIISKCMQKFQFPFFHSSSLHIFQFCWVFFFLVFHPENVWMYFEG